jgi:hypothetical protein
MTQIKLALQYGVKIPLTTQEPSLVGGYLEELNDVLAVAQRKGIPVLCLTRDEMMEIQAIMMAARRLAEIFDWSEDLSTARDEYLGILRRKGVPEELLADARSFQFSE